jgi:hypothetical protein
VSEEDIEWLVDLFHGQTKIYLDMTGEQPNRLGRRLDRETREVWFDAEAHLPESEVFRLHFEGDRQFGVYPTVGDTARWSCIDIDYEPDPATAISLAEKWGEYGIVAWVEVSKSKGFHVWVFCQDMPAATIRRAGKALVQMLGLPDKTEVNPKQDSANDENAPLESPNGWGNCVRLPYARTAAPGRNVMILDGRELTLIEWLYHPRQRLAEPHEIEAVAALWREPEEPKPSYAARFASVAHVGPQPTTGRRGLSDPDCRAVFEGRMNISLGQRDNQLYALAKYMKGRGIPESQAEAVMRSVWSRMENPPNDFMSESIALRKIRRAY